jgi:hypothetical protein
VESRPHQSPAQGSWTSWGGMVSSSEVQEQAKAMEKMSQQSAGQEQGRPSSPVRTSSSEFLEVRKPLEKRLRESRQ